ncbi:MULTISPECIES: AAA family ATPase [unclassified Halomonas]|uniref:ATP-dependent nuclease n=1 Tax=unclassified Halomonas TaxID=2609666 RepID=UPI0007D8F6E4|nr:MULTISPECIES: AAA family ATPase [unclassified Halomonas]MBT2787353.1 AAA family ATPase [Halomonas sp. ISL-106]MBT2796285.1 AAA family ATPase [Halomonas sp. ISL-104]OAL57564.1 ATP-dependent endonuclease [Halomonas sp. ALS9]
MHITKLSLINYRNFKNVKLLFNKGINTVIGENGSGKTNLFRAMRLLLDNSMPRSATKLTEGDFCRALDTWRGHWIIISIEFDDIASDESSQSLFLHGAGNAEDEVVTRATYSLIFRPKANIRQELSQIPIGDSVALESYLKGITIDDYETVLTGKSSADYNDPAVYKKIVGDFDKVVFPKKLNNSDVGIRLPHILNVPNEVSFTFIKALRDVVSDFHSNRTNPLLTLLKRKAGDISQSEFQPIADLIKDLNNEIEGLSDICDVRDDIKTTISDTVGDAYSPDSISIRSSLTDESDQLFQSLKLFVAETDDGYEMAIHEMSLGGANLLFLTLKLLEFKYQRASQSIGNFLLIEEPEAHIHTHIQKSLFDNINYEDTQIIYSTHSSYISEVSNIESMNIIGVVDGLVEVFQPSVGLANEEVGFVQRYLDATRSNLLFARSVILVEGDAEEILIPILIKKSLGLSLDEIGISLINIRSTGFENIAILFDNQRIKKRCSIITDLDAAFFDISIYPTDSELDKKKKTKAIGSQQAGLARKSRLNGFSLNNPWVFPFYANHTFEVDFIQSLNSYYLINITTDVYTQQATIDIASNELSSSDIAISGSRALSMANYQGKGWFALTLGKVIDFKVVIPEYIFDAIKFAHGDFNRELKLKMLKHRYESVIEHIEFGRKTIERLVAEGNTILEQEWKVYLALYENGLAMFTPKWEAFDFIHGDIDVLKANLLNDLPCAQNDILLRI